MTQTDNADRPDRQDNLTEQTGFTTALLTWYDAHRRILPWREDPTPYHVWLSEIMLQQTRVEAVKAYYARFLAALPDIAALAGATEDVCSKLWEGLGYYSRVRNLHRGAQVIMQEYGGSMPQTAAELQKIPGIGEYTSAAIASIAFGEPEPAVDGNLLRIFARLTAYNGNIKDTAAQRAAQQYYRVRMQSAGHASTDTFMPGASSAEQAAVSASSGHASTDTCMPGAFSAEQTAVSASSGRAGTDTCRPGDINQALMDLGSMVCTPGPAPSCGECPLQPFCAACEAGIQDRLPVMPEKKARKIEDLTVFLIHDADRIALHKRGPRGLLAGLYEYPNVPGHLTQEEALEAVRAMGFAPLRILPLPDAQHIFTHREWHMTGYEVLADELADWPAVTAMTTQQAADVLAAHQATNTPAIHPVSDSGIFLASIPQIRDVYAVPSAFSAFTAALPIPR